MGGGGEGVICAAGAALAGDDSGFIQIDSGDAAAEKYLSKSIWRRRATRQTAEEPSQQMSRVNVPIIPALGGY